MPETFAAILLVALWGHNTMRTEQVRMKDYDLCQQEKSKVLEEMRTQAGTVVITIMGTCIKTR